MISLLKIKYLSFLLDIKKAFRGRHSLSAYTFSLALEAHQAMTSAGFKYLRTEYIPGQEDLAVHYSKGVEYVYLFWNNHDQSQAVVCKEGEKSFDYMITEKPDIHGFMLELESA